jgi:hypothetical protein
MGASAAPDPKGPKTHEALEPYIPQPPKPSNSGSFLSALRRFSSGSQVSTGTKVIPNGGVLPRRVMNVDPNRERCLIPELDPAKLRRVAFCVDVEIAGGPKYKDEGEAPDEKRKKAKEKRMKEKGEGKALKNPDSAAEEKDSSGVVNGEHVGSAERPNPEGTVEAGKDDKKEPTKKKEKKKRSEEERKERKEKKRRRAEENGSIPVEFTQDFDESSSLGGSSGTYTPRPRQDRPTTDPLRIYRRCCQLRETPILKRISDQLFIAATSPSAASGIIDTLDLTGSRLQLADMVTLGDWLAVVPVKRLILEDSDLTDEGVRVILGGLLAAKHPETTEIPARRTRMPNGDILRIDERSGVVEKLTLKNNPKIGRDGWLHLSLFVNMCRSLKALDVSMIPFPLNRRLTNDDKNPASPTPPSAKPIIADIAEIFAKAIAERLAGPHLEELIMTECVLTSTAVRKIVDGVTVSGVQRLGLAGNNIDDAGLQHVVHYLRSGICRGLDLGGNDLRNTLHRLAEGINERCALFALSLADCNLTPDCLKSLFPALTKLSDFRFIDLSHNLELFTSQPSALGLLRKYLPQLNFLKRLHLVDVSMSPAQAIGLAEVLPEAPALAHLNILENSQLSALAHATDEASQEEACALYASLMTAVRVSNTIICIDVDIPSAETGEIVQALAKQVVAYCLRNLEHATASISGDTTEMAEAMATAVDTLGGHKDTTYPDVLMQLVGHADDQLEKHDDDEPAPDDDYIVGGTGVVKALSYCLLEKASDVRRLSVPASGMGTPQSADVLPAASRAKMVSKNLLDTARKIRYRLQPAILREESRGDEIAHRKLKRLNPVENSDLPDAGRLLFLDKTLSGIIERFEAEYPECRLPATPEPAEVSPSPPNSLISTNSLEGDDVKAAIEGAQQSLARDDDADSGDEHVGRIRRTGSDVSLASRALSLEEGQVHKLSQAIHRNYLRQSEHEKDAAGADGSSGTVASAGSSVITAPEEESATLRLLRAKYDALNTPEGRETIRREGLEAALRKSGAETEQLSRMAKDHPEEYALWKQAQEAGEHGQAGEAAGESAIED